MFWEALMLLLGRVGEYLAQPEPTAPPIPQDPLWGAPTEEEERWADAWCLRAQDMSELGPDRLAALTERQRYVLLPRIRFALSAALSLQRSGQPPDERRARSVWVELTVELWAQEYRKLWLATPPRSGGEEMSLEG